MRAGAAILLLLCLARPAGAQSDEARRTEARQHFEAGREHHKLGRFDLAIVEYEAAYQLVPLPDILFNIGQCHRNLKNQERAIFFFERFLQESPNAHDADLVRKLVAELEQELAQRDTETTETATVAVALPMPLRQELVEPPVVEEDGIHQQWWFWTIIAVGVAAAAAGGAYALTQDGAPSGSLGTIDLREN